MSLDRLNAIRAFALIACLIASTEPALAQEGPVKTNDAKANDGLPEIVVYENHEFKTDEKVWRTNVGYSFVGDDWNDEISSWIVVRGVWKMCKGANFEDCANYGVGYYDTHGMPGWDDVISSFCPVPADHPACAK